MIKRIVYIINLTVALLMIITANNISTLLGTLILISTLFFYKGDL